MGELWKAQTLWDTGIPNKERKDIDYFVEEHSRLLEEFKIIIRSTCSGHILIENLVPSQDGGHDYERRWISFIPGLVEHKSEGVYQFEFGGKAIDPHQFTRGTNMRDASPIMALPLEYFYDPGTLLARLDNSDLMTIKFKNAHLYFDEFDARVAKTEELGQRLPQLYARYSDLAPIERIGRYGFNLKGGEYPLSGDETFKRETETRYGSIKNYWRAAVEDFTARQAHALQLWKDIGGVCHAILHNTH